MASKRNILMTQRDIKILHFLFENRTVTTVDIHKYFFKSAKDIRVPLKRLQKLREAALIDNFFCNELQKRCYFITQKGLEEIHPGEKLRQGV